MAERLPQIDWDWKHLPSNHDQLMIVGKTMVGKDECLVVINADQNLLFIWKPGTEDQSYGVLK